MSEFDNWKEEQERIHNDYDAENAWYAGQQSQQAKIDELQARIDDFIQYLRDNHFEIPEKTIEYFEDILKGNKDEN